MLNLNFYIYCYIYIYTYTLIPVKIHICYRFTIDKKDQSFWFLCLYWNKGLIYVVFLTIN